MKTRLDDLDKNLIEITEMKASLAHCHEILVSDDFSHTCADYKSWMAGEGYPEVCFAGFNMNDSYTGKLLQAEGSARGVRVLRVQPQVLRRVAQAAFW